MNAHEPVLRDEVMAALCAGAGRSFIDGTFGAGGYTRALLGAGAIRVFAIDRDPAAIRAGAALARDDDRLVLVQGRFGEMDRLVRAHGLDAVDGVALDLGISTDQLTGQPWRGFSFSLDGPLDMRMEMAGASAADLVNGASERQLADIIFRYGEERRSRRVARAIVRARAECPITTTVQLAEIVRGALPRGGRIDPATRVFQAIRIKVNDELGELDRGLAAAERILAPGGRLAVVAFHSLEDRAVKRFLAARSGSGISRHSPGAAGARPVSTFTSVGRRAIRPALAEVARNPRSRSARLRVAERTRAALSGKEEERR